MPVIHILNPQDPIPEVKSSSAILDGTEVLIANITNVILMIMLQVLVDLNEDSWASDYFVIFFHSGANHPGFFPQWQITLYAVEIIPHLVTDFV